MKLKKYLFENNLTQDDLAKMLNKTQGAVSKMVRNEWEVIDNIIYSPKYDLNEIKREGK